MGPRKVAKNERFDSVTFDDQSSEIAQGLKALYINTEDEIEAKFEESEYKAAALCALEESLMWLNKAIGQAQLDREAEEAPEVEDGGPVGEKEDV